VRKQVFDKTELENEQAVPCLKWQQLVLAVLLQAWKEPCCWYIFQSSQCFDQLGQNNPGFPLIHAKS
jgi:hypothetical protein